MRQKLKSRMTRGALRVPASVLCALAGGLLLCSSPALAASTPVYTGNSFGPQGINASGEPEGTFANLQSVAVDQSTGDVYAYDADHGGGSLYKFNAAGEPAEFSSIGGNVIEGLGEVGSGEGEIAVDSSSGPDSGDVFVATSETHGEVVLIYNAAGELQGELKETAGVPWGTGGPCGVAVDSNGNVYVGLYEGETSLVNEYTPTAGTVTNEDYVASLWHLEEVCHVAANSEGDVYVQKFNEGPITEYEASQFNTSETPASGTEIDDRGTTLAADPFTGEAFIDEIDAISLYELSGSLVGTFGAAGEAGELSESYGVAVDHATGQVYADDKSAVEIFGSAPATNVYQSQFNGEATTAGFFRPYSLATDSAGDVFVADIEHEAIDVFNSTGSEVLAEITGAETKSKSMSAYGVAVNAAGDVYVADLEHAVVDEFEPTDGGHKYVLIHEIEGTGTKAGSFEPYSVAVGPNEEVFVGDLAHRVVDEFNATGSEVLDEITGAETKGEALLPFGIAVDAAGDVYVGDIEHNLVDEFESTGADEYALKAEISGEATPGGSFEPVKVAVAGDGDLYVADVAHDVVDRLSASGTYECQISGKASEPEQCGGEASETPQKSFEPTGLAVAPSGQLYVGDTDHNVVDIFSSATPTTSKSPWVTEAATEVTATSATMNGTVNPEGAEVTACEFEYGTNNKYGETEPCEQTSAQIGEGGAPVAVSAKISGLKFDTKYYFRVAGTTGKGAAHGGEATFTTRDEVVSPPTASIEPVAPIGQSSATFHGKVNPNGSPTTYDFEYSTDGVHWTALPQESAGNGGAEVSVSENATGLTGNTTYHVRLAATSTCEPGTTGCGTNTSGEETFTTLAGPPQISGVGATEVTGSEATLHATIHPENQPSTTYRFEYGTSTEYGTIVPAGEGSIGDTSSKVSQAISGLSPDTTYHFRVVASNGVGSPTTTSDQTFTTLAAGEGEVPPGACTNEQLRGESAVNPETGQPFSLQLPECRAYEMVSPLSKNGAPIRRALTITLGSGSAVTRVGSEGSTVLINSTGIWPGAEQPANNNLLSSTGSEAVQYRLTRGESGWKFEPEAPPDLRTFHSSLHPNAADISPNGIWAGAGTEPAEGEISSGASPNFYLLESDGALVEIGPSVPASDRTTVNGTGVTEGYGGVDAVGASRNLSDMLFNVADFRWSFDQTKIVTGDAEIPSLYEYIGTGHSGEGEDVPTLVGVDNTGALISQCGTYAAGHESEDGFRSETASEPEARSISAGGSTVFFTAQARVAAASSGGEMECPSGSGGGPVVNQVLARIGEPGPGTAVGDATTVNVAGSTECATSDSCNVTKPVTYQGASAEGSKVFFTSEQPLVSGDGDGTNNLYECTLPGDSGTPPARTGKVNACPDLVRVSVPVASAGAEVLSVAAVSEDGSHVYFVAKGVLSGENGEGRLPTLGGDNLYVWEAPSAGSSQGRTAFVATLSSAAFQDGEAQATPDGEQLVFTSSADLTPDDTSTVAQVFLYEAQIEALTRISKGQDGFNEDGNTTTEPASLASEGAVGGLGAPGAEGRSSISENGSTVVFQSSDALTPQVHGGTRNVYLWRGGNVYLISDGTPAGEHTGQGYAGLVGIDASGRNVFFTTEAKLVGQDTDELSDLYDARIDGGFAAPKVTECAGEACQGPFSPSLTPQSPGSVVVTGNGNLTPPAKSKPKPLTRAQKLAKALKACAKEKAKKKRAECKSAAHKRYGAKAKTKTKTKTKRRRKRKAKHGTGKPAGKGGK